NASTIYGEGAVVSIAGVDNFVPPLRSAGAEPRTLEDWFAVHNPVNARTDAGEYQASVSSLSPNYEVASVSGGRIEVERRHLAIKPSTRAVLYGDGFDPFAMVVAGLDRLAPFHELSDIVDDVLMTGESGSVLAGALESPERLDAGGYVLEAVLAPDVERNYVVQAWPGLLAVNPRLITLRVA